MRVDSKGYVERQHFQYKYKSETWAEKQFRNWWLIKAVNTPQGLKGQVQLNIILPKEWIGKKIKIKVEKL